MTIREFAKLNNFPIRGKLTRIPDEVEYDFNDRPHNCKRYKTKKRPRCYQHRERSNRLAYSKRAVTTDTVIIPLLGRLVKVYPKEVILLWQDSKKEKMAAINAR